MQLLPVFRSISLYVVVQTFGYVKVIFWLLDVPKYTALILWPSLVFYNLQCTLGQEYYSVPAYSLCSFLPDVFVNELNRQAFASVPLFVMPLTKLVSAFVNFFETTAPVSTVNMLFPHFYRFQFSLAIAFLFVSVCVRDLAEVYAYMKRNRGRPL